MLNFNYLIKTACHQGWKRVCIKTRLRISGIHADEVLLWSSKTSRNLHLLYEILAVLFIYLNPFIMTVQNTIDDDNVLFGGRVISDPDYVIGCRFRLPAGTSVCVMLA